MTKEEENVTLEKQTNGEEVADAPANVETTIKGEGVGEGGKKSGEEKEIGAEGTEENAEKEEKMEEEKKLEEEKEAEKEKGEEDEEEKEEPKSKTTPRQKKERPYSPPMATRPQRERKSAERFAVEDSRDKVADFEIKQGRGTALKDIPNIAAKMAKKARNDELISMFHSLLYSKRAKVHVVKRNILEFSGYPWKENDAKEKAKLKEKLERYTKEGIQQLLEFLDLPKAGKKEEQIERVSSFLLKPGPPSTTPKRKRDDEEVEESLPTKRWRPSEEPTEMEVEPLPKLVDAEKENLWKEVHFVGTEWAEYDKILKENWDFSSLEEAFKPGAVLHGRTCWIFGSSEGQFNLELLKPFSIPVIFAVVSPLAPSYKFGVTSVTRGEEIINMEEMHFGWIPSRRKAVQGSEAKIHVLNWEGQRESLRRMKEEDLKKFEYLVPYVFNPNKEGNLLIADTVLQILFEYGEGKAPIVTQYDWKFDEKDDILAKISDEFELPDSERDNFWAHCKAEAKAAKARIREEKAKIKEKLDSMSEAERESLKVMKVYKIYPKETPEAPVIERTTFVNRYFDSAHEVFPAVPPARPFSWGIGK